MEHSYGVAKIAEKHKQIPFGKVCLVQIVGIDTVLEVASLRKAKRIRSQNKEASLTKG